MCTSCKATTRTVTKNNIVTKQIVDSSCDYTIEQLQIWKNKLLCIKELNLFSDLGITIYKYNFAMGTINSIFNTGNICKYKKRLDEINDIIILLISLNKC